MQPRTSQGLGSASPQTPVPARTSIAPWPAFVRQVPVGRHLVRDGNGALVGNGRRGGAAPRLLEAESPSALTATLARLDIARPFRAGP